jgi:hypothetical protein
MHEIGAVLSFDKGFFFTLRELAIDPGRNVRDFLSFDRNRLVKPIIFLIITSLIYTILNRIFGFENAYISFSDQTESVTLLIFQWVQANYGYANVIMACFIALWVKLFFRKREYNLFEILVLLCFIMGMAMLIYAVFGTLQSLIGVELMSFAGMAGFIYLTWAIGQFYGKASWVHYLKAFLAYLLGMVSFTAAALAIGTCIDLLWAS